MATKADVYKFVIVNKYAELVFHSSARDTIITCPRSLIRSLDRRDLATNRALNDSKKRRIVSKHIFI